MSTTNSNASQKGPNATINKPANTLHATGKPPVSAEQLKAVMAKIEASVAAVEQHIDQYLKGKYALG